MKREEFIKKLEELSYPEIEPTSHKRRLKMALLSSGNFEKRSFNGFFPLNKYLKELLMPKRRLAFIGAISGVVVVAVVAVAVLFSLNSTPVNAAQQIADKSYQTVANLTPDQQAALNARMAHINAEAGDMLKALQEAKNAKDLKVLTYDQLVSQDPQAIPPGENASDMNNVKFLQFTDPHGQKIVLGIDQYNLPVLMSSAVHGGNNYQVLPMPASRAPSSPAPTGP